MSAVPTCSVCGAPLPAHAPGERCPRCLLKFALDPDSANTDTSIDPGNVRVRYFGDYELLGEIARGGMGVVFRARQVSLNRVVAVKMLLAGQFSSAEYVRRFRAEAEAAANLKHPNIVAIHEIGEHDGQQYFSMDYVEGLNFAQLVRENPLPPRRAAAYLETIARAIHYAHQRGVIHRDLKPSNVLLDARDQPLVTDFGLAKRVEIQDESGAMRGGIGSPSQPSRDVPLNFSLTQTGQVLGTPGFMPPEQAGGRRDEISPASDVYSLGALFYFLVTGRAPFAAGSLEETLHQVLHVEPVSPRLLNPSVSRDLEIIFLKCLEKDARQRFASAQELADELGRSLAGQPIHARPASAAEKLWRWCRRKPAVAALGGALLCAVALGVGGIQWQLRRAQAGELTARRNAYAADMNLAQLSLEANNLRRARELLDRHRPQPGQKDLRGWEWRRIWQECRGEALFSYASGLKKPFAVCWLPGDAQQSQLYLGAPDGDLLRLDFGRDGFTAPTVLPRSKQFAVIAASADGESLAVTGEMGVIEIWDRDGNRRSANLQHDGEITSLSFSADGQWLAVSGFDGRVKIWDWRSGALVRSVSTRRPRAMYFGDVAFAPTGHLLALGQADGRLRLIDAATGAEKWSVAAHQDQISALAFSPDGRLIASGSGYGETTIKVWMVEMGEAHATLDGHTSWISSLAFSRDGVHLASASADQTVRLWDVERPQQTTIFRGHLKEVHCLAFSPDGAKLASADQDGFINLWNVAPEARPVYPVALGESSTIVRFAQDESRLFVVDRGEVTLRDTTTFREEARLTQLGTNITALAVGHNEPLIAAGDREGKLKVWDFSAERELTHWTAHSNGIANLALTRDNRTLLSAGQDRRVKLWNVSDGSASGGWEYPPGLVINRHKFLPARRLWATAHLGHVKIWEPTDGRLIADLPMDDSLVDDISMSPDGNWFVAGSQSGSVIVFDARTWTPRVTLRGHLTGVHGVAFSPDGSRLATGSNGREAVKLWDTATWQELATLPSQGSLFRVAFSPGGRTLLALSGNQRLHLWHAPSFEEISRAENGREMPQTR